MPSGSSRMIVLRLLPREIKPGLQSQACFGNTTCSRPPATARAASCETAHVLAGRRSAWQLVPGTACWRGPADLTVFCAPASCLPAILSLLPLVDPFLPQLVTCFIQCSAAAAVLPVETMLAFLIANALAQNSPTRAYWPPWPRPD